MTEQVLGIYETTAKEWTQFSSVTINSIREIDSSIEYVENKQKTIEDTINNIKALSQHAQARSFVKICPRAYVAATIKHTGEYNVEINSEYQCTLTKDQTIEYLQEQLAEQNGILDNYRIQKEQLQKRLGFGSNDFDDLADLTNMPEKIVSDRGIAFKQAQFYEIMEVEAEVPYEKNTKRISRVKQKPEDVVRTNFVDLNINK